MRNGGLSEWGEFEAFVRAQHPHLVRLGVLLLGDRSLAEDLAQTALLKVYVHWRRIASKDAAGAYARTVMVRQASKWRRRRWTDEQSTDPNLLPDEATDVEADRAVRVELFRRALMALPRDQRIVLVLRYFESYTEAEIAEALRIPVGTVKSRAARAVAALRASGLHLDDDQETKAEQSL